VISNYRVGLALLAAVCSLPALYACSSDEIQAPQTPVEGELTVDASTAWAYASLDEGEAVSVGDPASEPGWDIGFNATRVMLNGGAAGPGGGAGVCLCQNAGATDAQVVAFTPASELPDFEAVTSADVPDDSEFQSDALVPAVHGWYTGSGAAAVAAPENSWLVRLQDGTSFAKLHVISVTAPTAEHAGQVTLEYAVQPAADQVFAPTQTVTLDASSPASIDLNAGATTGVETTWDLSLDGFTIRLNGGVSGSGAAAAAVATEEFAAIATASTDPRAYLQDNFGGVFNSHPWYRYNLTGENIIHPTFDVYLVKRGDDVYKVQLISYYGSAGEPRHITFRYARLTE
jgi:HmuY protein